MQNEKSRQRLYALLLAFGASVLLYRTLSMMLKEGALEILLPWAIILLFIEFLFDLACLVFSIRWFILNQRDKATIALRLGAAATVLHALRVGVYILGRTGPWYDFDIRPEIRQEYTFNWFWVNFAGVMAVLGLAGVLVVWWLTRNYKRGY